MFSAGAVDFEEMLVQAFDADGKGRPQRHLAAWQMAGRCARWEHPWQVGMECGQVHSASRQGPPSSAAWKACPQCWHVEGVADALGGENRPAPSIPCEVAGGKTGGVVETFAGASKDAPKNNIRKRPSLNNSCRRLKWPSWRPGKTAG